MLLRCASIPAKLRSAASLCRVIRELPTRVGSRDLVTRTSRHNQPKLKACPTGPKPQPNSNVQSMRCEVSQVLFSEPNSEVILEHRPVAKPCTLWRGNQVGT